MLFDDACCWSLNDCMYIPTCTGLVELHGGIIDAVSGGANTGSTFFF